MPKLMAIHAVWEMIYCEGVDATSAALCSAVEQAVWEMAYSVKGLIPLVELLSS